MMMTEFPRWLLCRFCRPEHIDISSPRPQWTVVSPITVRGTGMAGQHNQLRVQVRDGAGAVIGSGIATVQGLLGDRGPFVGVIPYSAGARGQVGSIEVFDTSPTTGAVTHLASVAVQLG